MSLRSPPAEGAQGRVISRSGLPALSAGASGAHIAQVVAVHGVLQHRAAEPAVVGEDIVVLVTISSFI